MLKHPQQYAFIAVVLPEGPADKAEIRRGLGYLPQDVGVYPSMSV